MKNTKIKSTLGFALLMSTTAAFAETADREPAAASYTIPSISKEVEGKKEEAEEQPHYLSGQWGGLRNRLSDQGFEFQIVYKSDFVRNLSGGVRVDDTVMGNLDLRLLLDAEKAWGWSKTSFMFYGLGNHYQEGNAPTDMVGDFQGTDNIQPAVNDFKLYEAYVQKIFMDDKLSILFGLHDLNTEFYATDSSTTLINSSFGAGRELSQSGTHGPSIFPYTAPALRLRYEPSKKFYVQAAAFNAQAGNPNSPKGLHIDSSSEHGYLYIAETGCIPEQEGVASKYAVGTWTYTENFAATNGGAPVKSSGSYVMFDHGFSDKLSAFLRYGFSPAAAVGNKASSNLSAGILVKSPFEKRDGDKFSFGLTQITAESNYQAVQKAAGETISDTETTFELTYRAEVANGLYVQPDFQYVVNPNFSKTLDSAQVGTVRFEFNF